MTLGSTGSAMAACEEAFEARSERRRAERPCDAPGVMLVVGAAEFDEAVRARVPALSDKSCGMLTAERGNDTSASVISGMSPVSQYVRGEGAAAVSQYDGRQLRLSLSGHNFAAAAAAKSGGW